MSHLAELGAEVLRIETIPGENEAEMEQNAENVSCLQKERV